MDRFGSSRLRIVWAGICLLLTGLVLAGVQGLSADGSQLTVLGTTVSMTTFDDPKAYVVQNLGRIIYTIAPAVILLGGILPLGEWLAAPARGERVKGLLLGTAMAFGHGLFLSQLVMLPMLAAGYRLLGHLVTPELLLADLNACVLGLQLLLWAAALGLLLKSNRGLAVLIAYGLNAVGHLLTWGVEFLDVLELPKGVARAMALTAKALPSDQLPTDPLALTALPLSLGAPLALAFLLLLLPGGKSGKRSKG